MPVFACPACGQTLPLPSGEEGRTVPCSRCGQSMLVPDPPSPVPDVEEETIIAEQVVVAGYEILEELGRGGMGVVYKARQVKLNRLVALKMILSGTHASTNELVRFDTEARAAASLQHPNIVQIYEVGEQDGVPYFSLAFVDGGSLAERMRGTPQPVRDSALMIETLARAVHFAHEHGIVHRDLKPANVLLTHDGQPRIADFGLAKRLQDATATGFHTQSGAVMGTPSYMAPEQASGRTADVGPATDIYALGAILYEMLTGRPPFRAATPMDTLFRVLHDEPTLPTRLRTRLPRDLETICLKCLEKDPSKRYTTALELAVDLRHFLEHEPILARPVHTWERGVHWVQRRRTLAALVLVSLVAILALTLVAAAYSSNRRLYRALEQADQAREAVEIQKGEIERLEATARAALYFNRIALAEREWLSHNVRRADRVLDECPEPLRGWEWNYLKRLCHGDLATLRGHRAPVETIAFSPDGRLLASGSTDEMVRLWDPLTERSSVLRGHSSSVRCVTFSPDGRLLASASDDGTVCLWDVATQQRRATLRGHIGQVAAVAFRPDGRLLVTGGEDRLVRVWDVRMFGLIHSLPGHRGRITALAFHPEGKRVVSASRDRTLRLWDLEQRREAAVLQGHRHEVDAVTFRPDGKRLASAGKDRTVRVWDAETAQELFILAGHAVAVTGLAFSPNGRDLATSGRVITVWNAETGDERLTLRGHVGAVTALAYRKDGVFLASAGHDHTIKVWDAEGGHERRVLRNLPREVNDIAFSADGRYLALAGMDRTVSYREAATGREVLRLRGHGRPVVSIALHPRGTRLAGADEDRRIIIWDTTTGQALLTRDQVGEVLAFHPEGNQLAVTTSESGHGTRTQGVIALLDVASGKEERRLAGGQGPVRSLAFTADGSHLASAGLDGSVLIWDMATGQPRHRLRLGSATGPINAVSVRFRPDARSLVTTWAGFGRPSVVQVWDVHTGRERFVLRGHEGEVLAAVYTTDSRRIVTAGVDQTIKVWDAETGSEVVTLRGHSDWVVGLAVSPDGRRLASTGKDRAVLVWVAAPQPRDAVARREAQALVDRLVETLPLKADVIAHLQADRLLPAVVRSLALEQIAERRETAEHLNIASWLVVRYPGASEEACRRALRRAEAATALEPGNGYILNTLGVACYRVGAHARALEILQRSDAINSKQPAGREAVDVSFLALVSQALGQFDKARAFREQLRELLQKPRYRRDIEAQTIAREVEQKIVDRKGTADP